MARHWTESEDTAVRLGAALDNDRGGQRQRELAARLDRTQAGLSGGARRACARPSSRATSRDHGPSGGRDERRRVTPVPADGVGDGAHYVVTTDEQRWGPRGSDPRTSRGAVSADLRRPGPVGVHRRGAGGLVRSIHHVTRPLAPRPRSTLSAAFTQADGKGKIARALRAFFCRAVRGKGTNHATGREAPRPRKGAER